MPRTSNPPPPIADHELLSCVGTGSYGEVWLARHNLLGIYRAVKIVQRARFDSDKPFEREFQGIKKFEPISRTHPGLIAVLHVGRNGAETGCFYYIMEVADDVKTGQRIDQATYKPCTLASEIDRRVRFPLADCTRIAGALCSALSHLHDQGLVHRDIKPSNIIFVNGVPKLADVGLVTSSGEWVSDVGTTPYMPREGLGKPTGDIFALGKVLYQMATGNGPNAFPELPTELDDQVVPEVMKLNPIFLKACDPNPQRRYQSASEMRAALELAARDGSTASRPQHPTVPKPAPDEETSGIHSPVVSFPAGFRVAILYRSNTQPDGEIVRLLERELTACKCGVFVDRHLTVGVDWARAIEGQIRQANAVIVLLSAASVASEMIACEVETAHQSRQQTGRPMLLPVRLEYEDPLPGVLGPILDPLHCFMWGGPEDNARMVEELFRALVSSEPVPFQRRLPPLEPDGGAVPIESPFYVVRPTDHEFQAAIARRDSIVLVKGARQMGKTSLLARGLQQARESDAHVVLTDFQKFNAVQLEGVEPFLQALGDFLAVQLKLDVYPIDVWDKRRGANTNFETYLRREVLGKISGHLVWGLDEVDRLFACSFAGEVFGLFRSWHNERALDPCGPWSRLTLAIAYATEAHLFITDVNQSPFNVGTRLTLEDFTFDQVADLNQRYGSPLKSTAELQRLFTLLGGQPHLVRRALNELAAGNVAFPQLLAGAAHDEGIFGDHLRRILVLLARDPELADAVRSVLQGRPCPSDTSFYRLRSAGVVEGDSPTRVQARCEIYALYLKAHLK